MSDDERSKEAVEQRKPVQSDQADEGVEARADAYLVSLPEFEGPLDLLLHLIQKHELDILDIPIGFIAEKYVEYIRQMEELSIDVAADYLVMAATLTHIKSKSLLPPDPNQADEDDLFAEEEDPRQELIRRLLEYQKYKNAAEDLGSRAVLGRDVFGRGAHIETSVGPAPLAQLSLFKLVDAFESVLTRAKQVEDHQIDFERISITEKIGHIAERLREHGRLSFVQLFDEDGSRAEMIVTFLALLEMTKLRMTHLSQDGPLAPIIVELSVTDEEDDESDAYAWPGGAGKGGEDVLARVESESAGALEQPKLDEADKLSSAAEVAEQGSGNEPPTEQEREHSGTQHDRAAATGTQELPAPADEDSEDMDPSYSWPSSNGDSELETSSQLSSSDSDEPVAESNSAVAEPGPISSPHDGDLDETGQRVGSKNEPIE